MSDVLTASGYLNNDKIWIFHEWVAIAEFILPTYA